MAHQINLGVSLCLAWTSSLPILGLILVIALLLSKHDTKVDSFINQCRFNMLQSLINFRNRLHLRFREKLRVEERQVQVSHFRYEVILIILWLIESL
jgi:uncharacterized membrane protein